MLSDKFIKNVRRTSFILLIGCPILFVIPFLDSPKKYEELEVFEGSLIGIDKKSYGYSSGAYWFTVNNAQGRFTACMRINKRMLNDLSIGPDIEIRGYHFGPCGIQAMQVSQNGRVIVSYADFMKRVSVGHRRLKIMSSSVFAISLVAFLVSIYARPEIKTFK
jgi:hypothetical protein